MSALPEDRLDWVRHQLELMVDTRLDVPLTIAETIRYNGLVAEEALLLSRRDTRDVTV